MKWNKFILLYFVYSYSGNINWIVWQKQIPIYVLASKDSKDIQKWSKNAQK